MWCYSINKIIFIPPGNRLCDSYSWLLKVSKMCSSAIKRRTRSVTMMPVLTIFFYSFFEWSWASSSCSCIYFGIPCFQVLSLYPAEMPVMVASWRPVYCWFLLHGIKNRVSQENETRKHQLDSLVTAECVPVQITCASLAPLQDSMKWR